MRRSLDVSLFDNTERIIPLSKIIELSKKRVSQPKLSYHLVAPCVEEPGPA